MTVSTLAPTGGAEYNAAGQYTGYRYDIGSSSDPNVIAASITDWSKVTDPTLCWHDPIFKSVDPSHPRVDQLYALNNAQDRCMGRVVGSSNQWLGIDQSGNVINSGPVNPNPNTVAYIGNTPVSQMTNLSPATAALIRINLNPISSNTMANTNSVTVPTSGLALPSAIQNAVAPIASTINSATGFNLTTNEILLAAAAIGIGFYLIKKKK